MKVYVITKGSYSDYHICTVTLDEQEAERLAKIYTDSMDTAYVEEWDTDEHQPLLSGRLPYIVRFHNGKNARTSVYRYTGSEKNFEPCVLLDNSIWWGSDNTADEVKLYAADSEAAVKIATEKRAQARAEKEGIT